MAANIEKKQWKMYTLKKEDKPTDFDFINAMESKLNEIAKDGYEPVIVQEMSRLPSSIPFIAIISKLPTNK